MQHVTYYVDGSVLTSRYVDGTVLTSPDGDGAGLKWADGTNCMQEVRWVGEGRGHMTCHIYWSKGWRHGKKAYHLEGFPPPPQKDSNNQLAHFSSQKYLHICFEVGKERGCSGWSTSFASQCTKTILKILGPVR